MTEELKFEGIASDEEFMCKFLAHLLNTNDEYLLEFLQENCKIENIDEKDLKYKKIDTELSIPHGRIDIVIELYKKLWLPIEAKLTAKDQEKQCEKYLNISMSKDIYNAKVCYLTIDGHKPEGYEAINGNCICLKWNNIECITKNFKYIAKWNNIHQVYNKVQCNYFNMFKQIDDTNTYANVCIDDYPTVKFGIIEKKCNGDFNWNSRIWYREMNIEDKNLKTECEKWLNQKFD